MATVSTSIYNLYGRFYNGLEFFFRQGLARTIAPLPFRPRDRVLDIGVGTGFSLRHYPAYVYVMGVDVSPEMLAGARRQLGTGRVAAQVDLRQADAMALPFADSSFDKVILSHVIATVPDPDRCLAEAARVLREGGILAMRNHFKSRRPLVRKVERWLNPVCRRLGWQTNFSLGGLMYNAGARFETGTVMKGVFFDVVYLQKRGGKLHSVRLAAADAKQARSAEAAPVNGVASAGAQ